LKSKRSLESVTSSQESGDSHEFRFLNKIKPLVFLQDETEPESVSRLDLEKVKVPTPPKKNTNSGDVTTRRQTRDEAALSVTHAAVNTNRTDLRVSQTSRNDTVTGLLKEVTKKRPRLVYKENTTDCLKEDDAWAELTDLTKSHFSPLTAAIPTPGHLTVRQSTDRESLFNPTQTISVVSQVETPIKMLASQLDFKALR